MIAGQETVDGGEIVIGETVQMAYVDQSRADLDPDQSEGMGVVELLHKEVWVVE